jgi:O-antigen ligase
MTPLPLALVCALTLVVLWRERRAQLLGSPALWIPWAWLMLISSRALSDWLGIGAPRGSVEAFADGSPIDRAAYLALLLAGLVVLARRRLPWADVAAVNKLLLAYGLYCAASTLWAEVPAIAARRLVKDAGNLVMALIVLTEPAPWRAAALLLRRVALVLLPASLLFVLAFPELGTDRRLDGSIMYTGVTNQKNELGRLCLVSGLALLWLLWHDKAAQARLPRIDRWLTVVAAALAAGLLMLSESRTALACLLLGAGLMLAARLPLLRNRPARVVGAAATAAIVLGTADLAFGLREEAFALLGRDATLTHRTGIWRMLLTMPTQPALGEGFMSFWSGPRLQAIWTMLQAGILQAHNGYLEQYLNLGVVGVVFMVALFVLGLLGTRAQLAVDVPGGLLRLAFLASAALYNVSEAAFHGQTAVWWLTLLGLVDTRALRRGDR